MSTEATTPPDQPPAATFVARPRRPRRIVGLLFRTTRNLLALSALGLLVLVLTPLENRLYDWLVVATYDPPQADVIVCLGGGNGREARAGVLWHRKVAPIVVVSNRPGAAQFMRTLVEDVGVPGNRILVDSTSYTTHDHPEGVARLPGINRQTQRFVIVTDFTHSRRARDCFLKAGYKHIVVWSGFRGELATTYWGHCESRIYQLPMILYEYAAMVKYKVQGKI